MIQTAANEDAPWEANSGGQSMFAHDWANRVVGFEGGWGAGKTWIGARKLVTLHCINAFDDRNEPTFCPSASGAPSYRNAHDVNIPELEAVFKECNLSYRWKSGDNEFQLPELGTRTKASSIKIRTADAPERIAGWQVGALWLDEPTRYRENHEDPKRDPLLQFMSRLRHPSARIRQALWTYTNEGDHTRVYQWMHDTKKKDSVCYRASTLENPHVPDEYLDWLSELPDHLRRQYRDGEAVSLSGDFLYPVFDKLKHIDSGLTLTNDLPLDLTCDFNIDPGMHAEIGQHFSDRDFISCVHEFHRPGMTVRDLVHAFGKWVVDSGGWRWPMLRLFGDATGNKRWAGTGRTEWDVLLEGLNVLDVPYRLYVPDANPFVADRVNAMNMAMSDLSGEPHWKCHPRCERLIADLTKMRRDKQGEIEKKQRDLSHASDAEGYRVYQIRPIRRRQEFAAVFGSN